MHWWKNTIHSAVPVSGSAICPTNSGDLYGGFDPAAEIRRLSGRIPCVHFKDMEILPDGEKRYCPVGAGVLDFDGILSALEDTGCRVAFIEQDECFGADPFDCLKQSLAYLKSLGLD